MFEDAELIHVYKRAQALEDGTLKDLRALYPDETRIFKYHVACTSAVWHHLVTDQKSWETTAARVSDLCWMAARGGIISRPDESTVIFRVILGRLVHTFKCICGPDDDASPCITIMEEFED
jgi:hypothetical protein